MACARKEQIRVNSREVKRTVRLLCLRSSEERLLWVPVIGKSRVVIPIQGTHHHYVPASVVYFVFHQSLEDIPVVGTRVAALGVETWEERATIRHRSHPHQPQRQEKHEPQRSQREDLCADSSLSPASRPSAGRLRSERRQILRVV
jgi:hypothetical protein